MIRSPRVQLCRPGHWYLPRNPGAYSNAPVVKQEYPLRHGPRRVWVLITLPPSSNAARNACFAVGSSCGCPPSIQICVFRTAWNNQGDLSLLTSSGRFNSIGRETYWRVTLSRDVQKHPPLITALSREALILLEKLFCLKGVPLAVLKTPMMLLPGP